MNFDHTDPYAWLVVYDLGKGDATVFWAEEIRGGEHGFTAIGQNGHEEYISHATPYKVQPKPREKTAPEHVAEREGIDVTDVYDRRSNVNE